MTPQPNPADLVRALGGTFPRPPERTPYIDSRFPRTYAYDFLRMAGVADSRSEAGAKLRALCCDRDLSVDDCAEALAFAYLRHHGIERS